MNEPANKVTANGKRVKPRTGYVLTVERKPGETDQRALARSLLDPLTIASLTLANIDNGQAGLSLNALIAELQSHASDATAGKLARSEETMTAHILTLDALFNNLVLDSLINTNAGCHNAAETYMRVAFKAQSRCRSTVETLAEMKNPTSVAFVRQANIANGPQEVNNGLAVPTQPSRAGENQIPPNKLLEAQHGERLDARTSSAASS